MFFIGDQDMRIPSPVVAIVSESFYMCGVEIVIQNNRSAIKSVGWPEPILIGPDMPSTRDKTGYWLPASSISNRGYFRTHCFSRQSDQILRKALKDVDIVHIHSISILTLRVMILVNKLNANRRSSRIKVVLHIHTQYDEYLKSWFGLMSAPLVPISKAIIRFCIRHADLVIYPCDFYREIFEKRFVKASEYAVWPSPIVIPKPNQNIRSIADINLLADKPLPDGCKLFTYVGRIGREKGIKKLIDRFSDLYDVSREPIGLVLIGPGEIARYRAYADSKKNGVGNYIVFLGLQTHENVMAINMLSWAGFSASITEVQGIAAIEQSLLGLPLVVPEGTCWEEMIRITKGGIFIDESPASILHFLKTEGASAGQRAQLYVRDNLSPKLLSAQLIQIYRRLMFSCPS